MVYSLQSPEFAQAFRIVTESILSALQSGRLTIPSDDVANKVVNTVAETADVVLPNTSSHSSINRTGEVRYAACPIRQGEGVYIFKNLKEEMQDESTYKIYRYDDGACEFELCELKGESRQIFKDNIDSRMPAAVGSANGEITADGKILTIKRGEGRADGRSVRITAPMQVEFS
jgi:hypothetical protein